jgi:hypothetical protein
MEGLFHGSGLSFESLTMPLRRQNRRYPLKPILRLYSGPVAEETNHPEE